MSEIIQDQQPQEAEIIQEQPQDLQHRLTPEEELALEVEREAAWEARLAPFKAVKRRLSDVEEVVTAMAEGML